MKTLKYKDKDGKWQYITPLVIEGGSSLPEDGEVGQVLTKTEEGVEWQDSKGGVSVIEDDFDISEIEIIDSKESIEAVTKEMLDEAISSIDLSSKEDVFTAGTGLEMTEDRVLNVTLDTKVFKVVEELPSKPDKEEENKIHLVLSENSEEGNIYEEYLYVDGEWELLGQSKVEVDLSNYVQKNGDSIITGGDLTVDRTGEKTSSGSVKGSGVAVKNDYGYIALRTDTSRGIWDYTTQEWMIASNPSDTTRIYTPKRFRVDYNGTLAPISVQSTTVCPNLNADMVDDKHLSDLVYNYDSSLKTTISSVPPHTVFSANSPDITDAPSNVTTWISGIMFASNWNPETRYKMPLICAPAQGRFYTTWYNTSGVSQGWKTFAYLDDNIASATKLETARTLWGQSFNGTGNVDSTLHLKVTAAQTGYNQGIRLYGSAKDSTYSNICFGCDPSATSGTHSNQWYIGRNDDNSFAIDKGEYNGKNGIKITSDLNVGIGTASPTQKLHVVGDIYATGKIIGAGGVSQTSFSELQSPIATLGLRSTNKLTISAGKQYFNDIEGTVISEYENFNSPDDIATILSTKPLTFKGKNVLIPSEIPNGDYLLYTLKYMQTSADKYVIVVTCQAMTTPDDFEEEDVPSEETSEKIDSNGIKINVD